MPHHLINFVQKSQQTTSLTFELFLDIINPPEIVSIDRLPLSMLGLEQQVIADLNGIF